MAYNNQKVKERQTVSQTQQTQQLGIVSAVPMNEWDPAVSYEKLNLVTYKNSTFIAKRPNTGIAPLDADGWQDVWMSLLNGVAIFSATIEYALGDPNSNTPPQDGWSTDIPALDGVKHLWTRLMIEYTDGERSVLFSVGSTISLDQLNDAVTKAQTAQQAAETAQQGALDAKTAAETAQTGALTAKSEAQSAAEAAQTSAQNAQSSAAAAEKSKTDANTALENAKEAEKGAQTAQQGALDAKTAAETAQTGALTAKSEAQSAAEAAQTSAQNAQSAATSASQSSSSASEANTAAQTAATQSAQSAEAAKKAQEAAQSALGDYYTKKETDSAINTAINNAVSGIDHEWHIFWDDTKPASLYGGTWEELPQGTFLMAAGHGGKAGESGGENQKTLSLDQTPNHYHDVYFSGGTYSGYKLTAGGGATTEGVLGLTDFAVNKIGHTDVLTTHSAGGGQPFDNRPLYRSVHIWQKVS